MIELISKHGFNINEKDGKGLTPIEHAAQLDSEKMIAVLVKCGADEAAMK
jgi:hypothetical protein